MLKGRGENTLGGHMLREVVACGPVDEVERSEIRDCARDNDEDKGTVRGVASVPQQQEARSRREGGGTNPTRTHRTPPFACRLTV
jgi:hypothetical protein